ncbi:hypothetical protein G7062_03215 [Erysipelothrix sp. HDW6C]|uniref:hypothetical protein n=1 Tax=Erysipelothrix sp. HDW6C TaxID=2714930 RepID=UPI00140D3DA6|nr:hypothetical protein [Erysipelothrix sp. HDW6C]QIK69364.1 hypothetical protein G7062_03215 [Erysipelothrix sp. HDW6C]
MKNNKKRTGVLAGLLAGALLVTGTLAWQDVSQHKTNKFTTTSVEHNVTLVETFEEVSNWRKGEAKVNEIAVRNGQETDDVTQYIYEDAYVRLQLKEFMEIMNKSYIYSEKRYMVDEKGNFNRFETLELAQEFMVTLGEDAPEDGRIEEVTGFFDKDEEGNAKGFFYIATQQADKNGQYGKFVVMSEVMGEGDVLVEGSVNQNHSSDDQHNSAIVDDETGAIDYNVDEDQYTTHLWGTGGNMSAEGNPFTQYVKWTFGTDVITMADWNGQPTAKWIVDTDSTEGYVYWGEKLTHGTDTTVTPKSLTTNLLEKVTLLEQPYGAAEYYIHVNMDAVNLKDVAKWDDAPEKITKAHNGMDDLSLVLKALTNAINEASGFELEGYTSEIATQLATALANAKVAMDNENETIESLQKASSDLESALKAFKSDNVLVAKSKLAETLNEIGEIDLSDKAPAGAKRYQAYLDTAKALLASEDANITDLSNLSESLFSESSKLVTVVGPKFKDGRIENFAGHNWTVVSYDEENGHAIITTDVLMQAEIASYGVETKEDNKMAFSSEKNPSYALSAAKKVDDAFFKKWVESDATALKAVLPTQFTEETRQEDTWKTRKDQPIQYIESGKKQAFTLGISDINYYEISAEDLVTESDFIMLRSVGKAEGQIGFVTKVGGLATGASDYRSNKNVSMMITALPAK